MAAAAVASAHNNEAEHLIALFDAAKASASYLTITLFADRYADNIAEYALRLWATVNAAHFEEKLEDFGATICRIIYVCGPDHSMNFPSISLHCEETPKVEVREPVPGILISVPLDTNQGGEVADAAAKQTPPTPDAGPVSEGAPSIIHRSSSEPPALDDAATRFSLLEID